jgi:hypothetical protein
MNTTIPEDIAMNPTHVLPVILMAEKMTSLFLHICHTLFTKNTSTKRCNLTSKAYFEG